MSYHLWLKMSDKIKHCVESGDVQKFRQLCSQHSELKYDKDVIDLVVRHQQCAMADILLEPAAKPMKSDGFPDLNGVCGLVVDQELFSQQHRQAKFARQQLCVESLVQGQAQMASHLSEIIRENIEMTYDQYSGILSCPELDSALPELSPQACDLIVQHCSLTGLFVYNMYKFWLRTEQEGYRNMIHSLIRHDFRPRDDEVELDGAIAAGRDNLEIMGKIIEWYGQDLVRDKRLNTFVMKSNVEAILLVEDQLDCKWKQYHLDLAIKYDKVDIARHLLDSGLKPSLKCLKLDLTPDHKVAKVLSQDYGIKPVVVRAVDYDYGSLYVSKYRKPYCDYFEMVAWLQSGIYPHNIRHEMDLALIHGNNKRVELFKEYGIKPTEQGIAQARAKRCYHALQILDIPLEPQPSEKKVNRGKRRGQGQGRDNNRGQGPGRDNNRGQGQGRDNNRGQGPGRDNNRGQGSNRGRGRDNNNRSREGNNTVTTASSGGYYDLLNEL